MLRWYGHVMRMEDDVVTKKTFFEEVDGKRSRGRQRLRWRDVIKRDMEEVRAT